MSLIELMAKLASYAGYLDKRAATKVVAQVSW